MSPAGKGGDRKARNTSHTRQLEDLLREEEPGSDLAAGAAPGDRAGSTSMHRARKGQRENEP